MGKGGGSHKVGGPDGGKGDAKKKSGRLCVLKRHKSLIKGGEVIKKFFLYKRGGKLGGT